MQNLRSFRERLSDINRQLDPGQQLQDEDLADRLITQYGEAVQRFNEVILNGPMTAAQLENHFLTFHSILGKHSLIPHAGKYDEEKKLEVGKLFTYLFSDKAEKDVAEDPIAVAAHVFVTLVDLQGFRDGNKRAANLIMNYVLLKTGFSPFILAEGNAVDYLKLVNPPSDEEEFEIKEESFREFLEDQVKLVKGPLLRRGGRPGDTRTGSPAGLDETIVSLPGALDLSPSSLSAAEIQGVVGGVLSRSYMVSHGTDIVALLTSGDSLRKIQNLLKKKGAPVLSQDVIEKLSRRFHFGSMAFSDYPSMLQWLQRIAGKYDREVYGSVTKSGDRWLVQAKPGHFHSAPASDKKRSFHTHPVGSSELSVEDAINFLVGNREQEMIVASSEDVRVVRKKDPERTRRLSRFLRKAIEAHVRTRSREEWERYGGLTDARYSDLPEASRPHPFQGKATEFLRDTLHWKLTGSLFSGMDSLLPLLGAEVTVFSQGKTMKRLEADSSPQKREILNRELDRFDKDPQEWIAGDKKNYIPHTAAEWIPVEKEETPRSEASPTETEEGEISPSGLEESIRKVAQAWEEVAVTPQYAGLEEASTLVFFPGTEEAIPLVAAKAGLPFVAFTNSQAGLEEADVLLRSLSVPRRQYQIRNLNGQSPWAAFSALEEENPSTHFYPLDPARRNWLSELLAGLEEMGILPVGDLAPAMDAAKKHFQSA